VTRAVPTSRRVIAVYIATTSAFTFAASLIWAINTLFLMGAGLNIFQVMVTNAAFTVGQLVFEIPTGVVADTVGRRISFMAGIGTLVAATVLYVLTAQMHWGLWVFVLASVLIGLGFTFQTGAVDAWLVDALDFVGYDQPKERVFARAGMFAGGAMLLGTIVGGFLGQVNLVLPYYLRAAVLVVCFLLTAFLMRDYGFKPRPLMVSRFGEETRTIFDAGIRFGWRNAVVRPLLWVSLFNGLFFIYAFYSLPPYLLGLLGKNYVWLASVVVAGFTVASIAGNATTKRFMESRKGRRSPGGVLAVATALTAVAAAIVGLVGLLTAPSAEGLLPFAIAAGLFVAVGFVQGVVGPVRQGFINEQIPSAQRATVLSLDSFFGDAGGTVGSLGFGYISQTSSIALAWVLASIPLAIGYPLYRAAERAAKRAGTDGMAEGGPDDGAGPGAETGVEAVPGAEC
jgi:MFS family permease